MENPSIVNSLQDLSSTVILSCYSFEELIDPLPDPIPPPPLNFENNAENLQNDTINEPIETEVNNNPHAYICQKKKNSFGSKFI